MSFKRYFKPLTEAKVPQAPNLSNYEVPGPKARFQDGDIVLVRVPKSHAGQSKDYFKLYHPAFCLPYMNAIGTVRLNYNNGYQSKYAIEVEDGNLVPIATPFLAGPFISVEAAKKYQGSDAELDVKDLKGFVANDVQSYEEIESEFKRSFCNDEVGFKWLDQPAIVKYKNFDVYVLAFKKNKKSADVLNRDQWSRTGLNFVNSTEYHYDREENPTRPEFDNGFVFCKVIDKLNKTLKKTSSIASSSGKAGEYFLQQIDYNNWWLLSDKFVDGKPVSNVFMVSMLPVNSTLSTAKDRIIKLFKQYEEGLTDGFELFKTEYNVTDSSTLIKAKEVEIHESILGPYMKEIEKYDIRCDKFKIQYLESANKIGFLPKKVTCKYFQIEGNNDSKMDSLEGLERCDMSNVSEWSSNVGYRSLKGFPEQLNKPGITIRFGNSTVGVKSLDGIPDTLYAKLMITNLKSFQGARNCTAIGDIHIQHSTKDLTGFFKKVENFSAWGIDEKTIADYTKYRDLEEKHPELEGIFS